MEKEGVRKSAIVAAVGATLIISGGARGQAGVPTLTDFLRAHKHVELFIPGLDRFSPSLSPDLILEADTGFSVVRKSSGCKAALRVNGNKAYGGCSLEIDEHDGKGPSRRDFSFAISTTSISSNRMIYDVERLCLGMTCQRDRELCWQEAADAKTRDCTLRPVYEMPTKATPARLKEFLSSAISSRFDLIYECRECGGAAIELDPSRHFYIRDLNNSMFPCVGKWVVNGLHIQGQCDNERKDFEGSFDFSVSGVTDGGITFDAHLCVPDPEKCVDVKGGFWLPHGRRDGADNAVVELVPGSKSTELFEAVVLRLRNTYREQWTEAGTYRFPVLIRGRAARHARVETEVFYSPDDGARALAEATAKVLAPAIGLVEPQPWPGTSEYSVVVVVGEKAATGGRNGGE